MHATQACKVWFPQRKTKKKKETKNQQARHRSSARPKGHAAVHTARTTLRCSMSAPSDSSSLQQVRWPAGTSTAVSANTGKGFAGGTSVAISTCAAPLGFAFLHSALLLPHMPRPHCPLATLLHFTQMMSPNTHHCPLPGSGEGHRSGPPRSGEHPAGCSLVGVGVGWRRCTSNMRR